MKEKAVIYARFSSDKQNEQSIDGQIRYCTAFAAQNNIDIVGSYIDKATSGRSTKKRDNFLRMIEDSKKHIFDKVLVWKLDRFARNRYDAAIYRRKLEENNVQLISVTENVGNGPQAVLMEALVEAMAQMYSQVLSQNVIRGMKETALNGRSTGGTIPFGYKSVDKHIVVNPDEEEAVRFIFRSFADGMSYKNIADYLNEKGFLTRRHKPFNKGSFHSILRNDIYIGVYRYDDIVREDGVPAIIDKKTFRDVQARLHRVYDTQNRKKKEDYLLTGKLFCGHCGDFMVGDCGTGRHGQTYYYYTCVNAKKRACDKKREKKSIEEYVVEKTIDLVLQPERIEFLAKAFAENVKDISKDGKTQKAVGRKNQLKKELDGVIQKFKNAKAKSIIDSLNEEAEQLEAAIEIVDKEIAQLKLLEDIPITTEFVTELLKSFCGGDPKDVSFQRRIIDYLVNSVFVYDDGRIKILYNIDENAEPVSYEDLIRDDDSCGKGSDVATRGSPLETYPNIFFIGRFFGFSLKRESRS